MEKTIKYEAWSHEELVADWRYQFMNEKDIYPMNLEYGQLMDKMKKHIKPENAFTECFHEVIEMAKESGLVFCSDCCKFVEEPYYIKTLDKCIKCHTENWD